MAAMTILPCGSSSLSYYCVILMKAHIFLLEATEPVKQYEDTLLDLLDVVEMLMTIVLARVAHSAYNG